MTRQEYHALHKAWRLFYRLRGLGFPCVALLEPRDAQPAIIKINHITRQPVKVKVHLSGGFTITQVQDGQSVVLGVLTDKRGLHGLITNLIYASSPN